MVWWRLWNFFIGQLQILQIRLFSPKITVFVRGDRTMLDVSEKFLARIVAHTLL